MEKFKKKTALMPGRCGSHTVRRNDPGGPDTATKPLCGFRNGLSLNHRQSEEEEGTGTAVTSETGFDARMSEQTERERPQTRQEVAAEIQHTMSALLGALESVPQDKWEPIIGKGAVEELSKRRWADSLLSGMGKGMITVGDARLTDMLQRIEDSLSTVASKEAEALFEENHRKDYGGSVSEFMQARSRIDDITSRAVEAGLTTPGQDLYAGQRRSPARAV